MLLRILPLFSLIFICNAQGFCPPGQTETFHLTTGAIFMSDAGKISSFQTFDITECLSACRKDATCTSANFETGLCTISRSNASSVPDALRTDDFPVFPNYLEKICLSVADAPPSGGSLWSFQRTVNNFLGAGYVKVFPVSTAQECLGACLSERSFVCASAEVNYQKHTCALSNSSQSVLQQRLQKVSPGERIDYFENQWTKEPRKNCEYNRIRGRVLKSADLVRSKVASLDDCKNLCLNASFPCNYYHYGQLSDDECSMSHHTAMTVSHISEPYVYSADFVSYELRACFSIDLACEAKTMVAKVTTNRLFDGLLYAKEQPKSCLNDVVNATSFELQMPLEGNTCGTVMKQRGIYSNYIMIQYSDKIVTSKDMGLSVSCEYDLTSMNVSGTLNTNGAPTITENVNYKVPPPIVTMSIRNQNGDPLTAATVGEKIYLQFDLGQAQFPDIYGIFVKDVLAVDGIGKSKIKMIDSNGCPSDDIVLGPVESLNGGKTLRIPIEAFKFPTNDEVEFMALIKPCQKQCDPAQCVDVATQIVYNSYGKRRKRENAVDVHLADKLTKDDVLVHQRININDFYTKCGNGDCANALEYQIQPAPQPSRDLTGIVCVHKLAVAIGASVMLLLQVAFVVALVCICQRRRSQQKSRFKAKLDISSQSKQSIISKFSNPSSSSLAAATDGTSQPDDKDIYDFCRADSLNRPPSSKA